MIDTQGLNLLVYKRRCRNLYKNTWKSEARVSCKKADLKRLSNTRKIIYELNVRVPESLKKKARKLLDFRRNSTKPGSINVFKLVRDGTLGIAGVQILKSGQEGGFDDIEISMLGAAWSSFIPESFPEGIWNKRKLA